MKMTRPEFEEALIPLTPDEEAYKINPNFNIETYLSLYKNFQQNNITINNIKKSYMFISKCNIFPNKKDINHFKSNHISFNRNDRFFNSPVHFHEYIELNYVFSGSCTAIINNKSISLATGDICIMDKGVSHTFLPCNEPDIVLNILLSSDYFSNSFLSSLSFDSPVTKFLSDVITESNEHKQYLIFHTAPNLLVKDLIENMIIEYLYPGICCESVLRFNLNLLFIELVRSYQAYKEQKHHRKGNHYLTEILDYMDTHCTSCTLAEVATKFNYNPNYLSRMLKEQTGSNFQDILCDSRMNRVAFLLKNSDMPIYIIANECGYLNQSFFRQKFIQHYGQSPKEYRVSLQT
jgi:AraC-like DNA-binding protein/mannose-6-phosphate isomerase-like protein (cupin superfamily)